MKTGDIITCPSCGRKGEVRVYPRETWNHVIHIKKGAIVTDSCIVKKLKFQEKQL
jgi:hypothetical protein